MIYEDYTCLKSIKYEKHTKYRKSSDIIMKPSHLYPQRTNQENKKVKVFYFTDLNSGAQNNIKNHQL